MEKKTYNILSSFRNTPIDVRVRMHHLEDLSAMLSNFYLPFNRIVNAHYSYEEQTILIDIIEKLIYQLKSTSHYVVYTQKRSSDRLSDLQYDVVVNVHQAEGEKNLPSFRLTLDSEFPFSVDSRLHCLQELDGTLNLFLALNGPSVTKIPYSTHEQSVLARILKILIHQLRGTPYYQLYVQKRRPKALSPEEQLELRNQQRDEARLRVISIVRYNPLSAKYKAEKEKRMREIEEMYGK